MKNKKLITLLILLAFLSFSCGDDDDKNGNGKGNKSSIDASKYLFQANSIYFYDINVIDHEGKSGNYKRTTEVYDFDSIYYGEYAMKYMENQEQAGLDKKNYIYAEGSKIYGINCGYNLSNHHELLFSNHKYELFKSILLIDLNEDEWEDYFEFEYFPFYWRKDSDYKVTTRVSIKGKIISENKTNYNGNLLNSFNVELVYDFDNYYFTEQTENYPKENHQIYKRNLVLVENVGIVKDEVEIYFYEKDGKGEETEYTYYRNFYLEKIEELK